MKPVLRALTTAVLATALTSVATTAAHADRWWGRDRSGDVGQVAFSPDPPPCGTVTESEAPQDSATDIVGLSVRHELGAVEVRAHFRDLKAWGDRRLSFDLQTDRRAYEVSMLKWRTRGPVETSLMEAATPPESVDECGGYATLQLHVPCDAVVTRSPAQDYVSVVLPRACLDGPRWVRAGVRTFRTVGERYRWDVWSRTRLDVPSYSGPFGPRVRHD